jgi:uncharacterized protein (TIGR02246 family)
MGANARPWLELKPADRALGFGCVNSEDSTPRFQPMPDMQRGPQRARRAGWIPALTRQLLGLTIGWLLLWSTGPALAASVAGNASCAPINSADVEQLFERWDQALRSGDAHQVSSLYSDDALLLPTLSAEPRRDGPGINNYFESFLAKAPEGRIESREIRLGCNQALDAGTYSFLLHPPGEQAERVQARYSFVYVFRNGEWRILHHHSSLLPTS